LWRYNEARCTDHTDFDCMHYAHDAADNECYLFAACLDEGRGLHSSTSWLNLSRFCH
jgi:hypothetical protein